MDHPYKAHAEYIAPARSSRGFGNLLIGVLIIETLFQISYEIIPTAIALISPDLAESFVYGDTAAGLLIQLSAFGLLGFWVVVIARMRHHRDFVSLIGPPAPALHQMGRVFVAVMLVFGVFEILPPYCDPRSIAAVTPPVLWLLLLLPSLLVLLLQTGAEELLYRGYIQQQLAVRWFSPWVWMVVPNLLFAAAHWSNGEDWIDGVQYVIWAFCFGLAASDLTARSGTLGPAIGFHLANNAYSFLLYGELDGPDSGLALFLFRPEYLDAQLMPEYQLHVLTLSFALDLALIGLLWLAARLAIRR